MYDKHMSEQACWMNGARGLLFWLPIRRITRKSGILHFKMAHGRAAQRIFVRERIFGYPVAGAAANA